MMEDAAPGSKALESVLVLLVQAVLVEGVDVGAHCEDFAVLEGCQGGEVS